MTLLESVREKLEDPSHSINLLDDSTSYEDGADLDGASEDLGSRIGGESRSESGGDGSLMLLEKEGSFEVRVGRESEGLREEEKSVDDELEGDRRSQNEREREEKLTWITSLNTVNPCNLISVT